MGNGINPQMQGENASLDVLIVGGCGHVGLPLGIMLARAGLQVGLHDTDDQRRESVRAGRMPFLEYGADAILPEVLGSTLHVVEGIGRAAEADYVVVTIGTPVDEHLNPSFGPMFDVVRELAPQLGERHHLMLRSTVYPGTTRELARFLERLGCRAQLSYCPERIVQGYAIAELEQLPQIVSGQTDEAVDGAVRLWGHLTDRMITVEFEEAELAKLYLNAWRYIQFAIANQFFMMAEERGADFFRIHHAMTAGYERASDFPLPGFTAGPCLLKDTMQLAAFHRGNFQLGQAAVLVNEGLANYIVETLRARYEDLAGKPIGILGMAFKANIDDTRDSLAYKLRKLLAFHGADVRASDLFVDDPSFVSAEELVAASEVVVIGAPHDAYRELEIPPDKDVVDVWGFLRRQLVEV
jgi:UDP-N-acetyl-D-mannosaminuronic acid dehydrogenase